MKRFIVLVVGAALLLNACGTTPSLWGSYPTPTSETVLGSYNPVLVPPATATSTSAPVPISEPVVDFPVPSPTPYYTSVIASGLTPTREKPSSTPTSVTPPVLYYSQSGDTLQAVAAHFGVKAEEITSSQPLPKTRLIDPGTLLVIPNKLDDEETSPNIQIMPDSELVFSASAIDFDIKSFVKDAGGELSTFREYLSNGWNSGAESVMRVAMENSINPRILIGVLDYEGNWVTGKPKDKLHQYYPMGFEEEFKQGVFRQMVLATNRLFIGYYGWRDGSLTYLTFPNGEKLRISPDLNAGTVAIQYFFSTIYNREEWQSVIDPNIGFPARYTQLLGDPWIRAQNIGPIFPPGLTQPDMVLPFEPNREWNYTGGPHGAWEHDGPLAAIDFAPASAHSGCGLSEKWIVAAMPGLVVRSERGIVVVDQDGDGHEQTGWDLLYLHVATTDRVEQDTWVNTDDRIGHASCEGGISTGTHLHMARKYNGEWVLADGPFPFILSGYVPHAGKNPYEGTLTKGAETITANVYGTAISRVIREPEETPVETTNLEPTPIGP